VDLADLDTTSIGRISGQALQNSVWTSLWTLTCSSDRLQRDLAYGCRFATTAAESPR
jgi:hypothetical protein